MPNTSDEDFAWLDGPSVFTGLSKRQLAEGTGFTLRAIDKLMRDGMPSRSGAKGLVFDLPAVVQWLNTRRAADDPRMRERAAAAALKEQEFLKRQGELVRVDSVVKQITDRVADLQNEFMTVHLRCELPPEQAEQVRGEIIRSINRFAKESLSVTNAE